MKYRIDGTVMQTVTIELEEGERIYSESGAMIWMSDNIEMKTEMKGGLGAGIGRMFSGESLFLTDFIPNGKGFVAFANEAPGKIIAMNLKAGESMIAQKDAFLCAQLGVALKTVFRKKLGAGLFGGEGFIMQEVMGPGFVFFTIDGEVNEIALAAGQRLKVDTGALALLQPGVKYEVEMMKGVKNMLFGGEGLFLATVEGPGKVWLQTMPVSTLANKIAAHIPRS